MTSQDQRHIALEVDRLMCRLYDDLNQQYSMELIRLQILNYTSEIAFKTLEMLELLTDRQRESLETGFDIEGDDLKHHTP